MLWHEDYLFFDEDEALNYKINDICLMKVWQYGKLMIFFYKLYGY